MQVHAVAAVDRTAVLIRDVSCYCQSCILQPSSSHGWKRQVLQAYSIWHNLPYFSFGLTFLCLCLRSRLLHSPAMIFRSPACVGEVHPALWKDIGRRGSLISLVKLMHDRHRVQWVTPRNWRHDFQLLTSLYSYSVLQKPIQLPQKYGTFRYFWGLRWVSGMKTYETSFLRNFFCSNCWKFLIIRFADVGEHVTIK